MNSMDLNIFNKKDPSGKFSNKKFLENNYPDELYEVVKFSKINFIEDIAFKELVYLFKNNIACVPKCKHPNCESKVKYINSTLGYREFCSTKCVSSDPNIIKRKELSSIEKYGYKTPSENKGIKEKIINTNLKRYGNNSPMSNKLIQEKSKITLNKNWGVDNPSRNKEINNKRVSSFKDNIGQYKLSYIQTSLDRYGVKHPWMLPEIRLKSDVTSKSDRIDKLNNKLVSKNINHRVVDINNGVYTINGEDCEHLYELSDYNFYYRVNNESLLCERCNPIGNNFNKSGAESNLLKYIKSIYSGITISNDRELIKPYEIDIIIPEHKLAIEYNGVYWHSEIYKKRDYHKVKTDMIYESDYNVLHIWEDDWVFRTDIIKSMVANKLGKSNNKIYARKCVVKDVKSKAARLFLDNSHIQGFSSASVYLGLYFEDNLVSIMTFSKPRKFMSQKSKAGSYELSRFCNSKFTNVVGGASKLFKHFIRNYDVIDIHSFSDRSYSSGNLYKKLGFVFNKTSKINYNWVVNKKRYHRYNFRKDKLVSMGYDSNKSEKDIMYEDVGGYRVWNSGQDKWIFKN